MWLRLVENLERLREPEHVGSWLAAVARHECLRIVRRAAREVLTDADTEPSTADYATVERRIITEQRDAELWEAFETLPPQCRTLLRVLIADPRPSYDEVAAALEMPIGSIGPTRQRCLDRLRRILELRDTSERE